MNTSAPSPDRTTPKVIKETMVKLRNAESRLRGITVERDALREFVKQVQANGVLATTDSAPVTVNTDNFDLNDYRVANQRLSATASKLLNDTCV